ncbi:MAG: heavy metal translocating P-type ATPase metal-binding domain-containing protein [Flavobacteriaceae bacterium]|nr:heavy metal translocating P-type ATPase metal-binding domain-containing protein [Flavobacteriaceae bacterium]
MTQSCYHCGQLCEEAVIELDQKYFCCNGCKTVYEILNQSQLTDFYELNKAPGIQPDAKAQAQFQFLDTPEIKEKIVDFDDDGTVVVTFHVPVIHCSSCVWVLESLHEIHPAITHASVQFTQRKVQITYKSDQLKLSELAQFMAKLGYKPVISLQSAEKTEKKADRKLLLQLAVAGFAFGNIMLFSLPEYIDGDESWLVQNNVYFRWFMFSLSLPVMLFSSQPYMISAYRAIRSRRVNIDIPIAIGILVLFLRSTYEIAADLSPGYFDSLAGLVFFMLVGRWFQRRTYQSLAFDRDYKSFYPIAVSLILPQGNKNILLSELKKGDRILLRDEEILPADAILMKGEARIDNSFVTGESRLIHKKAGDKIFAGGKQIGAAIELEIIEEVNQSYLTNLWNNDAFGAVETEFDTIINRVSRYFVVVILAISVISAIFWYFTDYSKLFQVVTAILIIACPCALGLSAPFTLGNVMRILGKKKLYVKDTRTIESMAKTDAIVLDKTGTITEAQSGDIQFEGEKLTTDQENMLFSLVTQSNHPLSRGLQHLFRGQKLLKVSDYLQLKGLGQQAVINNQLVQVGSKDWLKIQNPDNRNHTEVWLKIDGEIKGRFIFQNKYRPNLASTIQALGSYDLHILSGDNASEKENLKQIFPEKTQMEFNQSPQNKLNYIQSLQLNENKKVMMVGDGLNDAGALKQSLVGIAVAEDMNSFSPSCDAILSSESFHLLPKFIKMSKKGVQLVKTAFVISFLYNIIGLSFAVTGNLEPVVAAILMPVSSVSVVLFATLSSWISAYFIFERNKNPN